ncbi:uncharacterized protein LOC143148230 [Ptiloglossa arizonensis]|uniref:uncharacterized protein LOC143148230 n=1 Tax=Ptiloglossa arizonensis TaxID=3350558 RepID=UPI003FA006B3
MRERKKGRESEKGGEVEKEEERRPEHVLEELTWQEEESVGKAACFTFGITSKRGTTVSAPPFRSQRPRRLLNEADPAGQMSRSGPLTDFPDNDVCRLSRAERPGPALTNASPPYTSSSISRRTARSWNAQCFSNCGSRPIDGVVKSI